MSGRALIIVVTGIIITTSIILYNIGVSSTNITRVMSRYYSRQSAQDISQSGVNLAIRRLATDYTYRADPATGGSLWTLNLLGGKASIRVYDATYSGIAANVVCIQSIGIEDYNTKLERRDTSTAWAWVPPVIVPTWTKALVNLNGSNSMGGGVTIDGRDHNPFSAAVNAGAGNWGLWTTGSSFSQGGSSTIGGTNNLGIDFAPTKDPLDTPVVRFNQTWPGGFPTTPDSVFGYTDGTLKTLAKSGFAGSQYVTDGAQLKQPLSGVTYVDLPNTSPSNTWTAGNLKGTGILIVHNSSRTATIKNANGDYFSNGYGFSGIMVADDATNFNMDFWGAMVILTQTPQGSLLGTGSPWLRYSRQAMKNAIGVVKNGSQVKILGWYETGVSNDLWKNY